jgi:CBS domain-containing protein
MPQRAVRSIISRDDVISAKPDETVFDAAARMAENCCGCVLVCEEGRLVGIFTERDILKRVVAARLDPSATLIRDVMTHEPDRVSADTSIKEVIRRMDEFCYRHLPVMEGDHILGVVSMRDLPLYEIADMAQELDDRHTLAERMW